MYNTGRQTAVAASLSPLSPQVNLQSYVSVQYRTANSGSGIVVTTFPTSEPTVLRQCTIPDGKWCSSIQAEDKIVRTALILIQEDVSLHKVGIFSDSTSTPQRIQNQHPSQQVANSDEKKIINALASHTKRGCHLTFTWCPNDSGIRGNELADVAAKGGTTVEQEGVSHHYNSAKAAIWQSAKELTHYTRVSTSHLRPNEGQL